LECVGTRPNSALDMGNKDRKVRRGQKNPVSNHKEIHIGTKEAMGEKKGALSVKTKKGGRTSIT